MTLVRLILSAFLIAVIGSCSEPGSHRSESIVAELDAEIPKIVARGNSPSIQVAAVIGDRIIWSDAFGENTSVNHVYMNASVQKTITATAVLQLVEKGLVELDGDVQQYVPFPFRHPEFPEMPITIRMLLAHRSGFDSFPNQFCWDTESAFSPDYRPSCPDSIQVMDLGQFLRASLTPGGVNYDRQAWRNEPGSSYLYSVSTYPLMRYLVGHVSGQSYPEYVREHVFIPLDMSHSGFSASAFVGSHAIPYTRIDGKNIKIPLWDGKGWMMHTTAADMANLDLALMNGGRYGDYQLLQEETVELMQRRTTRFKWLFRSSDDIPSRGYGLGNFAFRGGWFGFGGSAPGYQTLSRYNPSKKVGFVIMSNVNAILGGGANYDSARRDIYDVQDALISILDPTFTVRRWLAESLIICGLILYAFALGFWTRRRRAKKRTVEIEHP